MTYPPIWQAAEGMGYNDNKKNYVKILMDFGKERKNLL